MDLASGFKEAEVPSTCSPFIHQQGVTLLTERRIIQVCWQADNLSVRSVLAHQKQLNGGDYSDRPRRSFMEDPKRFLKLKKSETLPEPHCG